MHVQDISEIHGTFGACTMHKKRKVCVNTSPFAHFVFELWLILFLKEKDKE
jgi:hypothetical protein